MRISYQQIYKAEQKCSKSKRKGAGCQRFEASLIDNLFEIQQVLQSKTYVPKAMRVFVADNGSKPREIYAPHYYDRVIHHILVPKLENIISYKFIHDSTANQKGKGTHFAVKRLQKMMRKPSLRGGATRHQTAGSPFCHAKRPERLGAGAERQSDKSNSILKRLPQSFLLRNDKFSLTDKNKTYYLQLDIHNFFYSIDKKILIQILVKHIKVAIKQKKITRDTGRDYYWLCQQILKRNNKTQTTHNVKLPFIKQLDNIDNDKGLPIGNLTSQFFGNVYLNELDQFVKHQLKVKHYVRYVDDFILLSDSPQQLELWQIQIQKFLAHSLSLRLKEVVKPKDIAQGIDFLGYIIRPNYNLVRRRILGNMYNRLLQWQNQNIEKVENGKIIHLPQKASDKIDSVVASYLGHFKHAKSYKIIQQKFSQFKWLGLLFYQDNEQYKSKRHTKKAAKLISQWDYFRFHYQPFVLLVQVGCCFVVLKQTIVSFLSNVYSHALHGSESKSAPSMRRRYDCGNLLGITPRFRDCRVVPPRNDGCKITKTTNVFKTLFKQSKLKPNWFECHQANLSKILKTLQTNSVSYVVVTQQAYVNNKLRKRKVSQMYLSNNLNLKEAI